MPRASEAADWWAEVEDVRERIEGRRAREALERLASGRASTPPVRRGVREVRVGRLTLVHAPAVELSDRDRLEGAGTPRRRPRPRVAHRVGPRPDRVAAWAVALGFLLVVVAMLSAHG